MTLSPILRFIHSVVSQTDVGLIKERPESIQHEARLLETPQDLSQSLCELADSFDLVLEGWAMTLELHDSVSAGHTQRVTELTLELSRQLGIKGERLKQIWRGSMLHDHGKVRIPEAVLKKKGPLSDEEWVMMHKHPTIAFEMLSPIPFLEPCLAIPLCHHERWDGKGYPEGLSREDIPLEARIFSVVDVWDALTNESTYKPALPRGVARQAILDGRGSQFDPRVVDIFLEMNL
jgi:HD-GYP domain-containing protein (c-di-GMP phosphodiesterase class II)